MSGVAKFSKLSLGVDGNYPGLAEVYTDEAGNLWLKEAGLDPVTVRALLERVVAHEMGSHSDFGAVMAQYLTVEGLMARLDGSLGNAPLELLTVPDVAGQVWLNDHLRNSAIHQRTAKYVIEVGKGYKDFTEVQAALDSVPTTGAEAAGPTRRYQVRVHPGVYAGPVTLTAPYVDLVGAGANQTVLEHGERHDGFNQATSRVALWVQASNVRVSGLRLRNTYDATGPNLGHATFALLIGPWVAPPVFPQDITVADCVCDAVGRDTVVTSPHLGGTVRLERVLALGYYDTVSVIGTDDAAVEFVDCVAVAREYPSTNAPWYVSAGNSVSLDRCAAVGGAAALNVSECTVRVRDFTAPGPLYLTPPANTLSRIYAGNVRCSRLELSAPHGVVEVVDLPVAGLRAHGAVAAGQELGAWRGKSLQGAGDVVNGALVEIGEERRPLLNVYAQDEYGEPGVVYPPTGQALVATHLGPAGQPIRDNVMSYAQLVAALGGKVDKATLLAKGDLLVATGAGTVARLAVPSGSGPWVLRKNAAAATGLEWVQGGVVATTTTDSGVLANHTAVTAFDQSVTIPANTLAVGQVWRISASGIFGCGAESQVQFRIKVPTVGGFDLTWGSATAYTGWTFTQLWEVFATFIVTAVGVNGTIRAHNAGAFIRTALAIHNHETRTIDTTIDNPLLVCASWAVAHADNKSRLQTNLLERLA